MPFRVPTTVLAAALVACGGADAGTRSAAKPEPVIGPVTTSASSGARGTEMDCPVTGVWEGLIRRGPFAGERMRVVVDADGAVEAVAGPGPVNQSWSLYGDVLSVQNVSDVPSTGACSPDESATYSVDFEARCTGLRLVAENEPCPERRATLDGLELSLQ